MRLIDADALMDEVDKSKHDNPHQPGLIRVNHRNEHDHFLRMIYDAPTVNAVVLPCKVGDTVYQADASRIYPITIKKLIYDAGHIAFDEEAIGKTVFLTREEAEAALAERKKRDERL